MHQHPHCPANAFAVGFVFRHHHERHRAGAQHSAVGLPVAAELVPQVVQVAKNFFGLDSLGRKYP